MEKKKKDKLDPKYIINIETEIDFSCVPTCDFKLERKYSIDGGIFLTGELYPFQIHEIKNLIKLRPLVEMFARSDSSDISQLLSLRRQSELLGKYTTDIYFFKHEETPKPMYYFDTKTKTFVCINHGIWSVVPKYISCMLKNQNKKSLAKYLNF